MEDKWPRMSLLQETPQNAQILLKSFFSEIKVAYPV